MYGFINICLKSMVVEKFGEETWLKIRDESGVPDGFFTYDVYEDDVTTRLVAASCKLLGAEPPVVLRQFGEHFFHFCKSSGYDHMLRTLGGDLREFAENLDVFHNFLSLSYKEMNAPSFRVEKDPGGALLLHYYSDRRGLYHIVPGIIGAVAKDFFDSDITMEVVDQMEELERAGKKEHVVFLVSEQPRAAGGLGPEVSPRPEGRSVGAAGGQVQVRKGLFQPLYPQTLNVDLETFCNAFPFHLVFDEQLVVRQAGVNLQRIVPGLQATRVRLDRFFILVRPEVTFSLSSIRKFINSHFVLEARAHATPHAQRHCPLLQLRGQMIWMPPLGLMLYQASPLLRSLGELEERGMHLSDIAPHDATRDFILLNQHRLVEVELSSQLERKKEELQALSLRLEEEKRKTENLLYAMLPKHVANLLKEGKAVEAGEFRECTILFSDVVTFTNICSACEPLQIVQMLNAMYLRFDRLTTVHGVYKVETIGDAYMVVGGVPVPVASHAERVANFALGMVMAAREVINPVTGEPIQIRVGLHSGPALAGVVGEKMPRYCLFGDTVNTASRMESHGLPDRIHLSPAVYRYLRDKSYVIQKRGDIEVKGKGTMTTYFLERNLGATEQQILGLPDATAPEQSDPPSGCRTRSTPMDYRNPPGEPATPPDPGDNAEGPQRSSAAARAAHGGAPSRLCALL